MVRTARLRSALLIFLLSACIAAWAQAPAPPQAGAVTPDWTAEDAAARKFALDFFRALRQAGSTADILDTYFDPTTLSVYGKIAVGGVVADSSSGCALSADLAAVTSDSLLRRKMVVELDLDYLEPLYVFAARHWTGDPVAADFDVHGVFPKKLRAAEKDMEFFRFAPVARHCAVERLETIGQLERFLDEAERAAALLRSSLPPRLWTNPQFQKQLKAAQGEAPLRIEHSGNADWLSFHLPINALFSVSVVKNEGRFYVQRFSPAALDDFIRRKPTPSMAASIAVADRFTALMHEELDLARPMQELMVRNAIPRLRARGELPFFFRYTMDSSFASEMSDDEAAAVVNESGDFLYLLFLHLCQVVEPGSSPDSDFDKVMVKLPPELLEAGMQNPTVSFLFKGSDDLVEVKDRDELQSFLRNLRDINAVMRRTLPRDAFASPNFKAALGEMARNGNKDSVSTADLSPDFSDPVEVYTLRREFLTFRIIREDGQWRIWDVDLGD